MNFKSHFKGKGGGTHIQAKEETHILKDPPKSIHTRKKERIETGDIEHNIRNDETGRLDNSLRVFNTATNPSIKVEYQNRGNYGGRHQLAQAKKAYRVNENFRPPMRTLEDILPLSRQKRPWVAATTNPGAGQYGVIKLSDIYDRSIAAKVTGVQKREVYVNPNPSFKIDVAEAKEQIKLNDPIHANVDTNLSSYQISLTELEPMFADPKGYTKEKELIEIMSNPSYRPDYEMYREFTKEKTNKGLLIKPEVRINLSGLNDNDDYRGEQVSQIKDKLLKKLASELTPNVSFIFYDNSSNSYKELKANMKDKLAVTAQAAIGLPISLPREGQSNIVLRDYDWKIIQTTPTMQQFIVEPKEVTLKREKPTLEMQSSPGFVMYNTENPEIELERRMEQYDVQTNPKSYREEFHPDEKKIELHRREHYSTNAISSTPIDLDYHDQIEKVKFKRTPTNVESNLYNAVIPIIQEGQEITLHTNQVRKKAADSYFERFSNELETFL